MGVGVSWMIGLIFVIIGISTLKIRRSKSMMMMILVLLVTGTLCILLVGLAVDQYIECYSAVVIICMGYALINTAAACRICWVWISCTITPVISQYSNDTTRGLCAIESPVNKRYSKFSTPFYPGISRVEKRIAVLAINHREWVDGFDNEKGVLGVVCVAIGFAGAAVIRILMIDRIGRKNRIDFKSLVCQDSIAKGLEIILGCIVVNILVHAITLYRLKNVKGNGYLKIQVFLLTLLFLWHMIYTFFIAAGFEKVFNSMQMEKYLEITIVLHSMILPSLISLISIIGGLELVSYEKKANRPLVSISTENIAMSDMEKCAQAVEMKTPTTPSPQQLPLDAVLADIELRDVFQAFLTREHSVENLLLWEAIEVFRMKQKSSADFKVMRLTFKKIYERFLTPTSSMLVNISSDRLKELSSFYESAEITSMTDLEVVSKVTGIYLKVQEEVYSLMNADSYKRFLISPEFDSIKESIPTQYTYNSQ